jgi:hypothetical protein
MKLGWSLYRHATYQGRRAVGQRRPQVRRRLERRLLRAEAQLGRQRERRKQAKRTASSERSETKHMSRWLLWLGGVAVIVALAVLGPELVHRSVEELNLWKHEISSSRR